MGLLGGIIGSVGAGLLGGLIDGKDKGQDRANAANIARLQETRGVLSASKGRTRSLYGQAFDLLGDRNDQVMGLLGTADYGLREIERNALEEGRRSINQSKASAIQGLASSGMLNPAMRANLERGFGADLARNARNVAGSIAPIRTGLIQNRASVLERVLADPANLLVRQAAAESGIDATLASLLAGVQETYTPRPGLASPLAQIGGALGSEYGLGGLGGLLGNIFGGG